MSSNISKPGIRPVNPCFSSGPCAKRPGWSTAILDSALVGRSHRSVESKERLLEVSLKCRNILKIPNDWIIGIVPATIPHAILDSAVPSGSRLSILLIAALESCQKS